MKEEWGSGLLLLHEPFSAFMLAVLRPFSGNLYECLQMSFSLWGLSFLHATTAWLNLVLREWLRTCDCSEFECQSCANLSMIPG